MENKGFCKRALLAFADDAMLVSAYPLWLSLPFDFLIKTTAITDLRESSLRFFPWADVCDTAKHRALRLACLTTAYSDIWNSYAGDLNPSGWSSDDPRLAKEDSVARGSWTKASALRTDFARRLAMVEIDVLVSRSLGMNLDQLLEIYRTHFPVLDESERGTWYDKNGRIVWTSSKALTGIGFRKGDGKKPTAREWEKHYAGLEAGRSLECEVDIAFLPSGPQKVKRTFVAPFTTCDREADYRRAWAFFEAHAKQKAA